MLILFSRCAKITHKNKKKHEWVHLGGIMRNLECITLQSKMQI